MTRCKWLLVLFIILCSLFSAPSFVHADETADIQKKIEEYESKIDELHGEQNTLSQQLSILNSNIELSRLRITSIGNAIEKLEKEIDDLADEIGKLEVLLTKRSELVLHRIPESYKRQSTSLFGAIIFSNSISDIISRMKYINRVQEEDAQLLFQLKATQNNFGERKETREKKKAQQEALKKQQEEEKKKLDQQKAVKQKLLEQTKNSEAVYQRLLANAKAELEAIQGIISGGGTEAEVGDVSKGDRIASVIEGSSCNSSGTHLHFMITKKGGSTTFNPFDYLKDVSHKNCSAARCEAGDQDAFNPHGSWDWPVDPMITLNQGYGRTWAVNNTWVRSIYTFHNGIDIIGSSSTVKAVQAGTLYRGFYTVGCRLQYVKLEHKDSDLVTFYLHVNY